MERTADGCRAALPVSFQRRDPVIAVQAVMHEDTARRQMGRPDKADRMPGTVSTNARNTSGIRVEETAPAVPAQAAEPMVGTLPSPTPKGHARWWCAVCVGCLVMLPFAWLLSHLAMLPFLLGLFFFVLFGLLVGAMMHRVASPNRPYGRRAILVGTTIVVLLGWTISIVAESRAFPAKIAYRAGTQTREIGGRTLAEYQSVLAEQIRSYLRTHYPPGGPIGYIHWSTVNGKLKKGEIADLTAPLSSPQRSTIWVLRVVLSVALLGFGIGSQTFLLRLERDPAVRMMDERSKSDADPPA